MSALVPPLPVLRVAGVPEHFNWPWQLAIQRGLFAQAGVAVEWQDVKTGTGALIQSIKSNECDIILALTEGLIADIVQGSSLRLIGTYVETPLTWAIVTGTHTQYQSVEDLRGTTIAVSRFTSGSHLMSCVLASQRGWRQDELSYVVKGSFENLRGSVNDGSASAFQWEKQMCKPFIDSGEIRMIGELVTPWPCFLMVSTEAIIDEKLSLIETVLRVVRDACQIFHSDPAIPEELASRFNFTVHDATQWLQSNRVTASPRINESVIDTTIAALTEAGILTPALSSTITPIKMIDRRLASLSTDIHSMRLYNKPELIAVLLTNLRAHKLAKGPLTYEQLLPYDQNHYEPVTAIDEMIASTQTILGMKAINVGSNLGGPARLLSGKYGVEVIAVELQQDLHATAKELTERCQQSLKAPITHVGADAVSLFAMLASHSVDLIYSFLTILHLDQPQRISLFRDSHRLLRGSGKFYSADWYAREPLTEDDHHVLSRHVYCRYLPSLADYRQQLMDSGFSVDRCEDVSDRWTAWVRERAAKWASNKSELVVLHGEDLYDRLLFFYTVAVDLMTSGRVGGVIIQATKQSPDSSADEQ